MLGFLYPRACLKNVNMPNRRPQAVEKPSPKKSLAEFLRPQPQESNENPSFPATCASEMTLLMVEVVTFLQENEPLPPCNLSRKSGFAAFSTRLGPPGVVARRPFCMPCPPLRRGCSGLLWTACFFSFRLSPEGELTRHRLKRRCFACPGSSMSRPLRDMPGDFWYRGCHICPNWK